MRWSSSAVFRKIEGEDPRYFSCAFFDGRGVWFPRCAGGRCRLIGRRAVQWKAASVVAAATMLALAGVAFIHFGEKAPASPELMRLEVLPPDKTMLQKFAVSPDGRKISSMRSEPTAAESVWLIVRLG